MAGQRAGVGWWPSVGRGCLQEMKGQVTDHPPAPETPEWEVGLSGPGNLQERVEGGMQELPCERSGSGLEDHVSCSSAQQS